MSWDEYIAEFDTCGCDGGFATVAWQDFRSTDLICGYRYKGGVFEGWKQGYLVHSGRCSEGRYGRYVRPVGVICMIRILWSPAFAVLRGAALRYGPPGEPAQRLAGQAPCRVAIRHFRGGGSGAVNGGQHSGTPEQGVYGLYRRRRRGVAQLSFGRQKVP